MRDQIINIIFQSLEEIKEENEIEFEIGLSTRLLGSDGNLDSLDFANFIVILEEKLLDELDLSITILSEKAFSKNRSPFYSVETLVDYVMEGQ